MIPISDDYANNFLDVIKVIEKKSVSSIFEYEFFKIYKQIMSSNSIDGKI